MHRTLRTLRLAVRHSKEHWTRRLAFHLEPFLIGGPIRQFALLTAVAGTIAAAGGLLAWLALGETSLLHGLWWALTRLLDGGTVAADWGNEKLPAPLSSSAPILGILVTITGVFLLAALTAAFATAFGRLTADIKDGLTPVYLRGHVLVLGWNSRGGIALREVLATAHGALPHVVILCDLPAEQVRADLVRWAVPDPRRILVRCGDPASLADLRRCAADNAGVVLVLARGVARDPRHACRQVMRVLLALRRMLPAIAHTAVIAEVSDTLGADLARLAWRDAPAGQALAVVQTQLAVARVLAGAVTLPGVFDVLHHVMALDSSSLALRPVHGHVGEPFDKVHHAVAPDLVIGLLRDGEVRLQAEELKVLATDRLIVLTPRLLPAPHRRAAHRPPRHHHRADARPPRHLLLVGWNATVPALLHRLVALRAAWQQVTIVVAQHEVAAVEAQLPRDLKNLEIKVDAGDGANGSPASLCRLADVVVYLARDDAGSRSSEADAPQLQALLEAEARPEAQTLHTRHLVELRSPLSCALLPLDRSGRVEVVVATEVVGLVLAQLLRTMVTAAAAARAPALVAHDALYRDLFAWPDTDLRRVSALSLGVLPGHPAAFAAVMRAARTAEMLAIGVDQHDHLELCPPRDLAVAATDQVVVLVRIAQAAPAD